MDKIDSQGMPDDTINIGDVMEVIETDPDYTNNKGKMKKMGSYNCLETTRTTPRCIIVEEPAQKQLRFRYECEGRSAGSIPGANSTPDNKTYPTIKVEGYKGKAVVVVSCVTKDEPFRPHPHKLVGREGCKQGVCTVPIPEDTMTVSFQNLGVQCVKKKEIEDALKAREDIRVDPFMTGFSHRSSPTSIDLNAVRLCFQVFLHTQNKGKYTNLPPIVSNPIYDKKAMSDLLIVKLSDCVCPVDGGSKDIILLCEKVAKEDIQVRFFEEQNGRVVWEGFGEFQPAQVHKQTAIWFRPPRYRTLEVIDPVKMFVQLRRPSDGATSAPVPFQMVSLGRPVSWSLRPSITKKRNYSIFSEILAQDAQSQANKRSNLFKDLTNLNSSVSVETQTILIENNNNNVFINLEDENKNMEVEKVDVEIDKNENVLVEKNEIQEKDPVVVVEKEIFDDTKSYTSLQLAFKNPYDITIEDKYEDVIIIPESPVINLTKEVEEKLPPLPPKRLKKGDIRTYSSKITEINDPGSNILEISSTPEIPIRSRSLSRQELNPISKDLPPTPCSTLPKSKKRKFLSGFFSHFNKSATTSRETTPCNFSSSHSLQTTNCNQNEKTQSQDISNESPKTNLNDDLNKNVNDNIKLNENLIENVTENLKLNENVNDNLNLFNDLDLTEAENYALYMTMPPFATQSEFDEASCYYAPVEGGKILNETEVQLKLNKT
ncbi:embryonic polarity protein dorsal-like isoform X1 [Onthophagus taurus]|uniref:embryonic polarity protein dorsal-like isoform X1 n=3 Tax=Onthophagus taurus TaxID=166361 RepID=UPI0039BE5AE5